MRADPVENIAKVSKGINVASSAGGNPAVHAGLAFTFNSGSLTLSGAGSIAKNRK
jgi:hypothetical protein